MDHKHKSVLSNMKRLAIQKMTIDAIPKDSTNGIADGLAFLSDPKKIIESARNADIWALQAVMAVRQAGEPNPYKDMSDEEIAGMLLDKIEKRKNEQRKQFNK